MIRPLSVALLLLAAACSSGGSSSPDSPAPAPGDDAGPGGPSGPGADGGTPTTDGGSKDSGPKDCGTAAECEQKASSKFDSIVGKPADLAAFLKAMPKGGDLHNHLTGAVYAETYLAWAKTDGDCVNTTTSAVVFSNQCTAATQPAPTSGAFFDQILKAWSMKDFVAGAENGHDHFFATFAKYGAVAGAHRDDDIADVMKRAADENQLYIETMFNLGKNLGTLAASTFAGTVTADSLPGFYDSLLAAPTFATQLAADVAVVNSAATGYQNKLGCSSLSPPAACNVGMRFIAQVARTGANDNIFGQLESAFEMAAKTKQIVGVNLSSPEDDVASLKNYDLHMAMLDFLNAKYTVAGTSPLHVTLHAGELSPAYLPTGYETANTYHVKAAVEIGHAERIGHGLDILNETDSSTLMDEMATRGVLVEVCLSSNDQILGVNGTNHPLSEYIKHKVPVALGTDDQGVSRSSMAGEYMRAVVDQKLKYVQLKTIGRDSLSHSFLPGDSLWATAGTTTPVPQCAVTGTANLGDKPSAMCQAFLDSSERATMQWELEHRFHVFESLEQ